MGIVFIDCPHEDWLEYARSTRSAEDLEKFNSFIDSDLNGSKGVIKEEWEQFGQNCKILRGIEVPTHIPVRMITSTQYGEDQKMVGYQPEDMKVFAEMQASIMKNVKDAKQIKTDKSGHFIHFTEPELVINSIKELVVINRKNE